MYENVEVSCEADLYFYIQNNERRTEHRLQSRFPNTSRTVSIWSCGSKGVDSLGHPYVVACVCVNNT